ncbi:hypothetical protein P5V15_010674 [Pogonomyrmex californicus]
MEYLIYYITILSVSLFYFYVKYKLSYWSRRGVKTPPTHWLFGNFKDCITFKKAPGQVMHEIYNSADPNDPYIGFYIFHKPMLLLRNSDLIKQTMIKDFEIFPNRRFGSLNERDLVGLDSILSIKQPRWKYLKSKLTPTLTGQKLKNMIPLMIESGKPMIKFIENLKITETGQSKGEIRDISSRYVSDVLASLFFGINTNSFEERENAFWENGKTIFRGLKSSIIFIILFFIPEWAFLLGPFIAKTKNNFRNIFWESMNARQKKEFNREDFIDSMLMLKNGEQNPIYEFKGDNLVAQPSSLYAAGFEATSTAIAFVLYELARHPEHQATVYKEIQTHLSGKELTIDLINKMTFLDRVITEALRLYPPLPVVDRTALKNYKLPNTGLIIEENVSVYACINAMGYDSNNFSNPQEFIPLRTETESNKFYENMAFGIGPRACIGQRLARTLTKVPLIIILSNYFVSYEINVSNAKMLHLFTYVEDGLYINFKKREMMCN